MRRRIIIIMCSLILLGIASLYYFTRIDNVSTSIVSKNADVVIDKEINKKELTITYFDGNMIDEVISYGNKYTKIIKVENNKNNETVGFAIKFYDTYVSDDSLIYELYYSNDNETYTKLDLEDNTLIEDKTLFYNLGVNESSCIYFKIVLIANNDENDTTIKGIFNIDTNLTDKELFMLDYELINNEFKNKMESINGIVDKGYYTLDISSFNISDLYNSYRGFIMIDNSDYSLPKYYYNIYSDRVMLLDYDTDDELKSNLIKAYDADSVKDINESNICSKYSNSGCSKFSVLSKRNGYSQVGFAKVANEICKLVTDKISKITLKNRGYVVDINELDVNYNNIKGYVVIDNTHNNKEVYLYISDSYFSVLGYNFTTLGEVSDRSGSLRKYVEFTYNMMAKDSRTACIFTGLSDCINGI